MSASEHDSHPVAAVAPPQPRRDRSHGARLAAVWLWAAALATACAARADWPQFLGPERDGLVHDKQAQPAHEWPAQGPQVAWKIPVGAGFAGPAILNDSVLLLDREDDARDVIRRIRLSDGTDVWRADYDAPGTLPYNGSRTTPACDGEYVFTIGPFGDVRCVRFADGSHVWSAHLLRDWDAKRPNWGVATSPMLHGDTVVLAPWGSRAALVALNKASGREVWRTANPDNIAQDYSSPVPMRLAGRDMIVASGKSAHTIGVDARTGERLWAFSDYTCKIHIASPTILEDGRILLTGGYNAGSAMFRVVAENEDFRTVPLWANHNLGSQIAQPLPRNGHIFANSNNTRGGLVCLSYDGEIIWKTGNTPGFDIGNLLIIDRLIYILNGKTGELVMAEASVEGYRELGRAPVLAGQQVWAPLAYKDGWLVLRDQTSLACIRIQAP